MFVIELYICYILATTAVIASVSALANGYDVCCWATLLWDIAIIIIITIYIYLLIYYC